VILIDANILMYAAGEAHAHKAPCVDLLERIAREQVEVYIDTEVLQEILRRYRAQGRWQQGRSVYDLTRQVIRTIYPVTLEMLDDARALMDQYAQLTARDALHASVALRTSEGRICSYDSDFDGIEGVVRIEPPQVV